MLKYLLLLLNKSNKNNVTHIISKRKKLVCKTEKLVLLRKTEEADCLMFLMLV